MLANRIRFRLTAACGLGALLACQSGPAVTADLAITHATVVDVEAGEVLPDHTVLVEDRRISVVGPSSSIRVPNDAETVDATGLFVIPGLWDAHVHSRSRQACWRISYCSVRTLSTTFAIRRQSPASS